MVLGLFSYGFFCFCRMPVPADFCSCGFAIRRFEYEDCKLEETGLDVWKLGMRMPCP